jgi:phage shock protein C
MNGASEVKPQKRLYCSRKDRMLTGVCGGIAEYLQVDSTLVRLFFVAVALTVLSFETALGIYFILWVVMPAQPKEKAKRHALEWEEPADAEIDPLTIPVSESMPDARAAKPGRP